MQVRSKILDSQVELSMSGSFLGEPDLPEIEDFPHNIPWTLDLQDLESMNSQGIRSWIGWITQIPFVTIYLRNVPPFFLSQASQVINLIPDSRNILSFRLSYYCEATGASREELFQRNPGEHFQIPLRIEISQNGEHRIFELDHMPDKTLKCLKGQYHIST